VSPSTFVRCIWEDVSEAVGKFGYPVGDNGGLVIARSKRRVGSIDRTSRFTSGCFAVSSLSQFQGANGVIGGLSTKDTQLVCRLSGIYEPGNVLNNEDDRFGILTVNDEPRTGIGSTAWASEVISSGAGAWLEVSAHLHFE
jgi:hypothetical protein